MISPYGLAAVCMLFVPSALARPTRLAAPQVIVLHGGPLAQRVELRDFPENLQLMLSADRVFDVAPESLRIRPRVRVVMYWGGQWKDRVNLPDSVASSLLDNGTQPGAFYPAWQGRPPLWVFGAVGGMSSSTRSVSPKGLDILKRHGIPIAIE